MKNSMSVPALVLGIAFPGIALAQTVAEEGQQVPAESSASDTPRPARPDEQRLDIGPPHKLDTRCPPPTQRHGAGCVLTHDVTIDRTLSLQPAAVLDCQGHRLTARVPAPDGNLPGTSKPLAGILMDKAFGAGLHNCAMDGFDIGVLVTRAKLGPGEPAWGPRRNTIEGNTIRAKTFAIAQSDGVLVNHNTLSIQYGGGTAVAVVLDSNSNQIRDNRISGSSNDSAPMVWCH